MAFTLPRAGRVTSGATPQVPLPFLSIWQPSPRHFGVGKGGCPHPAPHHFGSSGVKFRLAGTSPRQPVLTTLITRTCLLGSAISERATPVDEGSEDTHSAGVEVGRGAQKGFKGGERGPSDGQCGQLMPDWKAETLLQPTGTEGERVI